MNNKRPLTIIITVVLLLAGLLCGCGASEETLPDPAGTPLDIAAEIVNSQADIPPLEILLPDDGSFLVYLTELYGIPEEGFTGGVICYAGGVEASEIAVLAFSDEETAKAAEALLSAYIEARADSFAGYVPEQAALVEESTAASQGRYAALLVCDDPAAAEDAFLRCFEEGWEPVGFPEQAEPPVEDNFISVPEPEPEPEPLEPWPEDEGYGDPTAGASQPDTPEEPEEDEDEDPYDREAIVSAWEDGDPSGLSEKNRAIYDAAAAVIAQVITADMNPYKQELAIHDYITNNCSYDPEANSYAPDASPDPDNDNPYGMLVNGVGICSGYSTTFQLFMDMLGIECIIVPGRSGAQAPHEWNMVQLDGEWYCVDVTWDDPSGSIPTHFYFNVTSQFLRMHRHQWDESSVPETSATLWAWRQNRF